jgi:hypothetical protein
VVRPPLERVLSAYRFALRDTTILPEINKKVFEYWLPNRCVDLPSSPLFRKNKLVRFYQTSMFSGV